VNARLDAELEKKPKPDYQLATDVFSAQLSTIGQPGARADEAITAARGRAETRRQMNRKDMIMAYQEYQRQQKHKETQKGIQDRFDISQTNIQKRHTETIAAKSPVLTPEEHLKKIEDETRTRKEVEAEFKETPEQRAERIRNETKIREEEQDKYYRLRENRRQAWQKERDASKAEGKKVIDESKAENDFYRKYDNAVDEARKALLIKPKYEEPYLDTDMQKALQVARVWAKKIHGSKYDPQNDTTYRDILEALGYKLPE